MNVVLFGASVVAQSRDDSIWHFLKSGLFAELPSASTARLSFPSSTFNGPGYLCLDDLLALSPSHVILDWLSTSDACVDDCKLRSVYSRLYKLGIQIITLAMPRADTWEKRTPAYLETLRATVSCRGIFIDFASYASQLGYGINDVTRDGVHTSELGAKACASLLISVLKNSCLEPLPYLVPRCYRPLIESASQARQAWHQETDETCSHSVCTYSIGNELRLDYGAALHLTICPLAGAGIDPPFNVEIWSLQTVGPYSRALTIDGDCPNHSVPISDPWCYYERHSFKLISSFSCLVDSDSALAPLNVNARICDMNAINLRRQIAIPDLRESRLRLHNRIYCVNCTLISVCVSQASMPSPFIPSS
jgi:hypothetical protein